MVGYSVCSRKHRAQYVHSTGRWQGLAFLTLKNRVNRLKRGVNEDAQVLESIAKRWPCTKSREGIISKWSYLILRSKPQGDCKHSN
jgi:hypothetical protein